MVRIITDSSSLYTVEEGRDTGIDSVPLSVSIGAVSYTHLLRLHCLEDKMARAVHIAWATGGNLVPESVRQEYRNTFL